MDQLQSQKNDSFSGMLLKEPRQGNVRKIASPIYSDQRKVADRRQNKNDGTKKTKCKRKSDEFTQ
ncbi:MAG: hypothetical protein CMM07_22550 [Rhodopirellula sp.]|nr:hypothetical protein [Rhodopirellula sp.]